MKLVIEIDITADGVQDYEDISEIMEKLMRRFDRLWRDDAILAVGQEDDIRDRYGNMAGKWGFTQ